MLTQRPRGTSDLLPQDTVLWQHLEEVARECFERYNYDEIRVPVFEHTELFARGVGETTDIVSKEMYTFSDRAGRSVTLRPEGTAGVIRAYVENKLYGSPDVSKLYYIGPMFRYEKPQKGRYRQFHQYGCEVLKAESPALDAEVIALNVDIIAQLGAKGLTVELNSVGCPVCRPLHKDAMIAALTPYRDDLCRDCQERLERNPLRIFDCKNEHCHEVLAKAAAPTILDMQCDECNGHFAAVKQSLAAMNVAYVVNPLLVRGLDYYTRTAWEVTAPGFGTVAGGGRYNALVAQVGGPETPGIGFAGGVERLLLLLREQNVEVPVTGRPDVYVAVADASGDNFAVPVLQQLRRSGYRADRDYQGRSLKTQLKAADRVHATFVAILGEAEASTGSVTLKHLDSGKQDTVPLAQLTEFLKQRGV